MTLSINNICHSQRNGPGHRLVIWTQGCPFRCVGCFNPETHALEGGQQIEVEALAKRINSDVAIEGITISGGEPLLHAEALGCLFRLLNPELTIVIYSGFRVDEIKNDTTKMGTIRLADLAIMGRYDNKLEHPYLGKEFLKMSDRIDLNYFKPKFFIEYAISHGHVTKTGIF